MVLEHKPNTHKDMSVIKVQQLWLWANKISKTFVSHGLGMHFGHCPRNWNAEKQTDETLPIVFGYFVLWPLDWQEKEEKCVLNTSIRISRWNVVQKMFVSALGLIFNWPGLVYMHIVYYVWPLESSVAMPKSVEPLVGHRPNNLSTSKHGIRLETSDIMFNLTQTE